MNSSGPAIARDENVRELHPRHDAALPERFARSASARGRGAGPATADVPALLAEHESNHPTRVLRIPFAGLCGWSFQPGTLDLVHDSGRFFSVAGLRVEVTGEEDRTWEQPIIVQPEIGVLGILAREFDGVLHFLLQVKMEPGNPNRFQLSPTVQATRSNYSGVHRGSSVRYLEHFLGRGPDRVLVDVLGSEHGSWFLRKANRNMIVETVQDVTAADGFAWLTLGQIGELLHLTNIVNMDVRTVLACAPGPLAETRAAHTDVEVLSWITEERARRSVTAHRKPLGEVERWNIGPDAVEHESGRFFRIQAVSVEAQVREVTRWTQPLLAPIGRGIAAFLVSRLRGVPHVLVHARVEGGFLDVVELGPTVQCTPRLGAEGPAFLDRVVGAPPHRVLFDTVLSEEGGRFDDACIRYLVVEIDEPELPPHGYLWVTPGQLGMLVRHGRHVNVQARTLLAVLHTGAVDLARGAAPRAAAS